MSVLARADATTLAAATLEMLPDYVVLRGPEAGLVMLRGRIGATGQPFNLGEASVVRCTVRSELGHVGHAYCLGRELQQAELAAAVDAALQDPVRRDVVYERVIVAIETALMNDRALLARRAAATEVQFFTMATMRT